MRAIDLRRATLAFWAAIVLSALLLTGCASTAFYDRASGRKIASFQSDITGGNYHDGSTSFTFTKMNNSTTNRIVQKGINSDLNTAVSAASLFAPGATGAEQVVKAGGVILPHVSNSVNTDKTAPFSPIISP